MLTFPAWKIPIFFIKIQRQVIYQFHHIQFKLRLKMKDVDKRAFCTTTMSHWYRSTTHALHNQLCACACVCVCVSMQHQWKAKIPSVDNLAAIAQILVAIEIPFMIVQRGKQKRLWYKWIEEKKEPRAQKRMSSLDLTWQWNVLPFDR